VKIFMPLIASGIGVAAFFCFMFSWVELLLSRTLTAVDAKPIAATMTRTQGASGDGASGHRLGRAGGGGGADHHGPGALVIYFVRNYIAKGFALARRAGSGDAMVHRRWPSRGFFAEGMEINVVSETITTHEYESVSGAGQVLAFTAITGIQVTHDLIGEGDVVERCRPRCRPARTSTTPMSTTAT
jgi:hypothetical protein